MQDKHSIYILSQRGSCCGTDTDAESESEPESALDLHLQLTELPPPPPLLDGTPHTTPHHTNTVLTTSTPVTPTTPGIAVTS